MATHVRVLTDNPEHTIDIAVSGADIETLKADWERAVIDESLMVLTEKKKPGYPVLLNPHAVTSFTIVPTRGRNA